MSDSEQYRSCKFCLSQALLVEQRDERIRKLEAEVKRLKADRKPDKGRAQAA